MLETLVAISVLILATVGPMTLASDSIRNASLSRNQTVAYFLAEEAAEFIHNRVTSNSFSGDSWLEGFGTCLNANGCRIDVPDNQISGCPPSCPVLEFDGTNGLYGYGGAPPVNSLFTRTIRMQEIVIDQEVQVDIIVEWEQVGGVRQAIIEDHLLNWR
ncbi:MAG: hypothetical protein Q8O83_02015 [bacterium]|nr:hypothetical protein [bacterium]